jgi:hypothetical protein
MRRGVRGVQVSLHMRPPQCPHADSTGAVIEPWASAWPVAVDLSHLLVGPIPHTWARCSWGCDAEWHLMWRHQGDEVGSRRWQNQARPKQCHCSGPRACSSSHCSCCHCSRTGPRMAIDVGRLVTSGQPPKRDSHGHGQRNHNQEANFDARVPGLKGDAGSPEGLPSSQATVIAMHAPIKLINQNQNQLLVIYYH